MHSPFRVDGAEHITIGNATNFQSNLWIYCGGNQDNGKKLIIGSGCVFGYNNHISCIESVIIEDEVLTANNVFISDNIHSYNDVSKSIMNQPIEFKGNVKIGKGSWIGENVCIIGASVGKNCVVGANSVVTRDIPDFSVAVGSPAKVIKYYDSNLSHWKETTSKETND